MTRPIKKWSDEVDAKLQDWFASTDWNMFRDSSDGIEEYTTSVTGYICSYSALQKYSSPLCFSYFVALQPVI